jgi:AraC-like DNA-binding protein/predicted dithiol-disulfide oxidoreductase (DUF899 family)
MVETSPSEDALVAAIKPVLAYIQSHLDDPVTPEYLANLACYSRQHFNRLFRAVVGESVMDHIRRVRLERSAYRLRRSHDTVASIAFDAGYGSQEAFTRIFQAYYGIAPGSYRYTHASHVLPSASGIHYSPAGWTPLQHAVAPELLDDSGLCPAHRHPPMAVHDQLNQLLEIMSGFHFAEIPRPRRAVREAQERSSMDPQITEIDNEIDLLLTKLEEAKQQLAEVRRRRPKEAIPDYLFKDMAGGEVRLSELFGQKEDLIVIHNMGASCIYCTVWADGIMGLMPHFSDRATLVVSSPDSPEAQRRIAAKRNWTFPMVSCEANSFPRDMGFWQETGPNAGALPGVSTFNRDADGSIYRIAKSHLGVADASIWPILELLEGGVKDWEPKYSYGDSQ